MANLLAGLWLCQYDVQRAQYFMTNEESKFGFCRKNALLNVREMSCRCGAGNLIISSNATMAGDPDERYCDRDGDQGVKQGMDTIDERAPRGCIGDDRQGGEGIGADEEGVGM